MTKLNQSLKLTRRDGKIVDVIYYENFEIDEVEILDIIYDLYSEAQQNEKSFDSPSTVSASYPVTSRSHYRMITYSIDDLIGFVNLCVKKNYG